MSGRKAGYKSGGAEPHRAGHTADGAEKHGFGQRRRRRSPIFWLIPLLALTGMFASGALFMKDFLRYQEARSAYAKINAEYVQFEEGAVNGEQTLAVPQTRQAADGSAGEQADSAARTTTLTDGAGRTSLRSGLQGLPEGMEPPKLRIDFAGLQKLNPDLACVIYIPALSLCYPVAYSQDNQDYLHKSFQGKDSFAGSIFYDALSQKAFNGENTFIFGHNMKDGSMFGSLKKLAAQPELWEKNPYIYCYTAEAVYCYRMFAYYRTLETSVSYQDFEGDSGYDAYLAHVESESLNKTAADGVDFANRPSLLSLSTCSGSSGDLRFLLHGVLVEVAAAN